MPLHNANRRMAELLVGGLAASGMRDVCLSPGSRSTALALAVARRPWLHSWVVTDERSAGFFALGLARESGRPVMLLCTSGTAAANFSPAVIEASLSGIPLVVLTADRPAELRDCRAAQTIDQVGLYGRHARWSVDAPTPVAESGLDDYWRMLAARAVATALEPPAGPVHLNLPMREPLFDVAEELTIGVEGAPQPPRVRVHRALLVPDPAGVGDLAQRLSLVERGLVVCGPGTGEGARAPIVGLAHRLGWPLLADPLSELRFGGDPPSEMVDAYDLLLRDPRFASDHRAHAVLRFGTPPVSKALEHHLVESSAAIDVVVAPPGLWPDPGHRASDVVRADAALAAVALSEALPARPRWSDWLEQWTAASHRIRGAIDRLLDVEIELFEGKVPRAVRDLLPEGASLHVGNSMPVRDLDTFVGAGRRALAVSCNRGANGIDGVVSAALGAVAAGRRATALVVGDLSFLHDVGALQAASHHRLSLLIVVINNDGGGIFSFLPQRALGDAFETYFGTPHGFDLEGAAVAAGARFARPRCWAEFADAVRDAIASEGLSVVEVRSDRERNLELHRRIVERGLAAISGSREVAA